MWLCRGNGAQVHHSERDPETRTAACETGGQSLLFVLVSFCWMFHGVFPCFRQPKWSSTISTQKSSMLSSKSLSIYCTSGEFPNRLKCTELSTSVAFGFSKYLPNGFFAINVVVVLLIAIQTFFGCWSLCTVPRSEAAASTLTLPSCFTSSSDTSWWIHATEEWSSSSPSSARLTSGRRSPRFSSNSLR